MIAIPNCCAMPLDGKVGDTYVCITCSTTYRHLIGGWTLAGPIVDLAPELQANDPTETLADYVARKGFLRRDPTPCTDPIDCMNKTCGCELPCATMRYAPELQAPAPCMDPECVHNGGRRTPGFDGPEGTEWPRHRYEDTLDEDERTGN